MGVAHVEPGERTAPEVAQDRSTGERDRELKGATMRTSLLIMLRAKLALFLGFGLALAARKLL